MSCPYITAIFTNSAHNRVAVEKGNAIIKRMMKLAHAFILISLFLAACQPQAVPQDAANLPTVAALPTITETLTPTITPTETATLTATVTSSETPTLTLMPGITPTLTVTPSVTITDTITPTPTNTVPATAQPNALNSLLGTAVNTTVLPSSTRFAVQAALPLTPVPIPGATLAATLGVDCAWDPPGGFAPVFKGDPALASRLGCPEGAPPTPAEVISAYQPFVTGAMVWTQGPIFVLFSDGRFQRFEDTYDPNTDPISGGETPPANLFEPVRGFGKIWRGNPNVRTNLGWAAQQEVGDNATVQEFDNGRMIYLPQRGDILALIDDPGGLTGRWQSFIGVY